MTVNNLIQIDKLVQLLESPVFTCKLFLFRSFRLFSVPFIDERSCAARSPTSTA